MHSMQSVVTTTMSNIRVCDCFALIGAHQHDVIVKYMHDSHGQSTTSSKVNQLPLNEVLMSSWCIIIVMYIVMGGVVHVRCI